ncbi:hypothetical protein [Cryobacterium sp. M15]|jgi:hypothetical protein|uniref:hypothetical protein n=1 Tax=Cryobacterium sp. M15 TaxID=2048291 RepID=UPI0011B0A75F|nr:hypothetical protein [Cryobacterium sp. M15]
MTVAMISAALVTTSAVSAEANIAGISGQLNNQYDATYYDSPRTNTYGKNAVAFKTTGSSAGGGLCMALRPTSSASGTFARGCGYSAWNTIKHDNGNPYIGYGTFYLSVANYGGACGGDGCGNVSWTADFMWNERWY